MIEFSRQEKKVILFLSLFAIVGIVALSLKGYSNRVNPKIVSYAANSEIVSKPININEADIEALSRIPGIGPKLASDIVAHRERNGYFLFPEDIQKVRGIGKTKFEKIKRYISCE